MSAVGVRHSNEGSRVGRYVRAVTSSHPSQNPRPAGAPHGHPAPSAAPFHVCGTPPKSWQGYTVGGIIIAALGIGVLLAAVSRQGVVAGLIGIFFVVLGLRYTKSLVSVRRMIGKPIVTAGPDGLWVRTLGPALLPWSDVRACGFLENTVAYTLHNPSKTVATRTRNTSLVVTRQENDETGRPIQVGSTLPTYNDLDAGAFAAAVRRFAPHVELRTDVTTSDIALDRGVQERLAHQWATTGRMAVTNRRGTKEKLVFDRQGIHFGRTFVPWASVVGIGAVTDVHTTSHSGIKTTERVHRLVIMTSERDRWDAQVVHRLEYPTSYQPPLEQFLPALRSVAPHLPITDRRTV